MHTKLRELSLFTTPHRSRKVVRSNELPYNLIDTGNKLPTDIRILLTIRNLIETFLFETSKEKNSDYDIHKWTAAGLKRFDQEAPIKSTCCSITSLAFV